MKILLNFIPLKSGGGIQVGLDFIEQAKQHGQQHEWFLVATAGTAIAQVQETDNVRVAKVVPNNLIARVWFEHVGCKALIDTIKPAVVYTQFGPHWPGAKVANVVGCAYSNLFYPEIDFWGTLPLVPRVVREVVDWFRGGRLFGADAVIFETPDLAERAVRVFHLPSDRVHCVRPSVSSLVNPGVEHRPTRDRCADLPKGFRVLLLASCQHHKNIDLLPDVAHVLRTQHRVDDVVFVITIPPGLEETRRILSNARRLGVERQIYNFGPVPHAGCAELYKECDAVILPSSLESLSNKIAEAWTMQKPLLISDLDWARSCCGDGAVYVRYRDPGDIARKLLLVKESAEYRNMIVEKGRQVQAIYPSPRERFAQYLAVIEAHAGGVAA